LFDLTTGISKLEFNFL